MEGEALLDLCVGRDEDVRRGHEEELEEPEGPAGHGEVKERGWVEKKRRQTREECK
jgi:hypothetical protein